MQKRRLVAKNRIPAAYSVGGLQVPLLETTANSFRLNLLQKLFQKTIHPNYFPPTVLPSLLRELLQVTGRPDLEEHIYRMGPKQWKITTQALRNRNLLLSQTFTSVSELLQKFEMDKEVWHQAPLFGHSLEGIFLYP